MKFKLTSIRHSLLFIQFALLFFSVSGQYSSTQHRPLNVGEIAVSAPGNYGIAGTTYVLTNDISSTQSPIFLGNNVVLDLNGYSITYADGNYEHVPNFSFEDGLVGWDFSKAPSAEIENTKVHVFVGDKILRLSSGEEIISQYITLPVGGRSYYAMCGVTKDNMSVSVYVEDEQGNSIVCNTPYKDGVKKSCPIENTSPKLGGGFVIAHLTGQVAGKYRIRVKANTTCLIDYIDIRPSMDVGIGIVESTHPYGTTYHLYNLYHSAFYDYTSDFSKSLPKQGIPVVTGSGNIVIRNGVIKNGTNGILSWGIQSTANNINLTIDNVKLISSGINTNAIDVPQATITNCYVDIDSPFIIQRHGSSNYGVDLRGGRASEVSYSDFFGGQGCLVFKGPSSKIHNNFFANRQTVTNHYSIMAGGDGSKIYDNVFRPEIGSGIEIYKNKRIEIFNNEIYVEAAPPTCEYGHEDYSVNAIRIADYNAAWGSVDGCVDNKIYGNKIFVVGKDYPEYSDYTPVATAIFYSASGGDNYIYDNEISINALNPDSKAVTSGLYIGGGTIGGEIRNNKITSNVPSFWVASMYGSAKNVKILNNEIIKSVNANAKYVPVRLGYSSNKAENIEFRSNIFNGSDFAYTKTGAAHTFLVAWSLKVSVLDNQGIPLSNVNVKISDNKGVEVINQITSVEGIISTELNEFSLESNGIKNYSSPYKVVVDGLQIEVELNKNAELVIKNGVNITDVKKDIESKNNAFYFAPNPINNELKINFNTKNIDRRITLVGITGNIYRQFITNSESVIFDLSGLTSGVYVLQVVENGIVYSEKLIKQ